MRNEVSKEMTIVNLVSGYIQDIFWRQHQQDSVWLVLEYEFRNRELQRHQGFRMRNQKDMSCQLYWNQKVYRKEQVLVADIKVSAVRRKRQKGWRYKYGRIKVRKATELDEIPKKVGAEKSRGDSVLTPWQYIQFRAHVSKCLISFPSVCTTLQTYSTDKVKINLRLNYRILT